MNGIRSVGVMLITLLSGISEAASLQQALEDEFTSNVVPGEYLVQYESQMGASNAAEFLQKEAGGSITINNMPNSKTGLVKVPLTERGWINFNEYLELIERAPGINSVDPNFYRNNNSASFSDPMIKNQWYLEAINAPKAWQVSQDASNITVAVIDSAIMVEHEDLSSSIWQNSDEIPNNGVDDDRNGYVDDVNGYNFGARNNNPSPSGACASNTGQHGSHVAGAIGAITNNRTGIAGVAPNVKIMALSIGRTDNKCALSDDGIIEAINYAVDNGAKIINMSLGGPSRSKSIEDAVARAANKGILLVISAGNDGISNDVEDILYGQDMTRIAIIDSKKDSIVTVFTGPKYPVTYARKYPGVLGVANLNQGDRSGLSLYQYAMSDRFKAVIPLVKFQNGKMRIVGEKPYPNFQPGSSYGKQTIKIGAPGTDILSTVHDTKQPSKSSYVEMTGTSMASPITAGAAALVWSTFPDMSNEEIKQRLIASARKDNQLKSYVGEGAMLDVYNALCGEMFNRVAPNCPSAKSQPSNPTPPPVKSRAPQPRQPNPQPAQPPVSPPAAKPAPKPVQPEAPKEPTLEEREQLMNDWLRS